MGQMIDAIAEFFGAVLGYTYSLIPNFGIAIIILTLLLKVITFPLNNKQIQSAKKMQELQPELKKIQQKYKNDREKQNKAVMEFMQENKVNPMAGCLPLLIQFPILIGIFRLLNKAQEFGVTEIPGFNPFLIPGVQVWGDLLAPDPFYILPILSGVTTYVYQKQTMTDPNQKMLLYMMPALITFISFKFPAGLVLYWVLNNLFSMGQHYLIIRWEKMKEGEAGAKGKKGEKGEK